MNVASHRGSLDELMQSYTLEPQGVNDSQMFNSSTCGANSTGWPQFGSIGYGSCLERFSGSGSLGPL